MRTTSPCEQRPEAWDLDSSQLVEWLAAMRICVSSCPLLEQCVRLRDQFYPESNPQGVIWAGVAYTMTGEPLLAGDLRTYAKRKHTNEVKERERERAVLEAMQRVEKGSVTNYLPAVGAQR